MRFIATWETCSAVDCLEPIMLPSASLQMHDCRLITRPQLLLFLVYEYENLTSGAEKTAMGEDTPDSVHVIDRFVHSGALFKVLYSPAGVSQGPQVLW